RAGLRLLRARRGLGDLVAADRARGWTRHRVGAGGTGDGGARRAVAQARAVPQVAAWANGWSPPARRQPTTRATDLPGPARCWPVGRPRPREPSPPGPRRAPPAPGTAPPGPRTRDRCAATGHCPPRGCAPRQPATGLRAL